MEKPLITYIVRRDSDLEDALFERTEMAAVTKPKDVTEYKVRVSCMRFQGSKKETAASTLQNTDDTRRAKTIPRNTTRYSSDSFGHCEECIHFPHVESRPQMRQRQTCCMDVYTTHSPR